ncbi:unnamed protein product [Allacma fusca]|uniref:Uncharacterized protein n=1 Tax=Allacma fusca TaxID=39272 RepID=A0A8J2KDI4_9HEXA|nr:unnamed protein product [Allacma fusca]
MVTSAVLGAATGTGLALVVAMTIVIYRYYTLRKRCKDWGDLERFDAPHLTRPATKSFGHVKPYASTSGAKYPYSGPSTSKSQMTRWDSRGSRTSTKSCPPLYTYPQQVGSL